VNRNLKKGNVDIFTRATAKSYVEMWNKVTVTLDVNGEERQVTANYVLVTVGSSPNTFNLSLDNAGVNVNSKGYIEVDLQCKTTNPIFMQSEILFSTQIFL
jgi:dihydrolipoamide dehydrogenase